MFSCFYVLLFLIAFPPVVLAEGVDYDKPFPEIKNQISSFDLRHSLMPKSVEEDNNESSSVIKTDNVQTSVVENMNENTNDKNKDKDDFQTIVVGGIETEQRQENNDLPPVKLKPIHLEKTKENEKSVADDTLEKSDLENNDFANFVLKEYDDTMKNDLLNDSNTTQNNLVEDSAPKSILTENMQDGYFIEQTEQGTAMAHIASYLNEKNAYDGLKILENKYPQFNIFEPFVRYENVDGKGWYYRLYLVGDRKELDMLCKDMKKNNDWCYVLK